MATLACADAPHDEQNDASILSLAPQFVQYRRSVMGIAPHVPDGSSHPARVCFLGRELRDDYKLMGARFDPNEAVVRNLGEFTSFAPFHEAQMRERLLAFLRNAGLEGG